MALLVLAISCDDVTIIARLVTMIEATLIAT